MESIAILIIIFLLLWFLAVCFPTRNYPPHKATRPTNKLFKAKVGNIIDGDTIEVSNSGKTFNVRLSAINCPEHGQPWGSIARAGLIKLIGGHCHVYLEIHKVDDRYGRSVATIYKEDGLNVNEQMVMLGHAWVYRQYYHHLPKDRQNKLDKLERWAKAKRVGLWKHDNPMPPWKWKQQQHPKS